MGDPWKWVGEHACAGSERAVSWHLPGRQQSREGRVGSGQMVQSRDQGLRRPAAQRAALVVRGVFGGKKEESGR